MESGFYESHSGPQLLFHGQSKMTILLFHSDKQNLLRQVVPIKQKVPLNREEEEVLLLAAPPEKDQPKIDLPKNVRIISIGDLRLRTPHHTNHRLKTG